MSTVFVHHNTLRDSTKLGIVNREQMIIAVAITMLRLKFNILIDLTEVLTPTYSVADPGGGHRGHVPPSPPLCALYYIVLSACAPLSLLNYIHTLVHPHLPFVINFWICP